MQTEAFAPLYEKYRDHETSPACEPVEKVITRLEQPFTCYYLIMAGDAAVGAIRVVDRKGAAENKRISPIFILPEYWGRGMAQQAILAAEAIQGAENWELETILQEPGNCHLYEKMGYRATGRTERINERLTLVYYEK